MSDEIDLSKFINNTFALRKLLSNKLFHESKKAINKNNITPEKEPHIYKIISNISQKLMKCPDLILLDNYELSERQKDWLSLVNKEVIVNNDIITIDTRTRPGHKILDHHMPHFYNVKNYKGKSVRNIITQAVLEKALYTNMLMHSTPYKSEIRRMIIMNAGLSNVTKYRAITAKSIIQFFNSKRILDPCIGWGGRMMGCLASCNDSYYVGCEPDENTAKGLRNILTDNALPYDVRARAFVVEKPAELALLTDIALMEKFDMVITSPPYFNLEMYTDEKNQSITTYAKWEDWVEKWLKPVILNSIDCLQPTGVSCWSVKNFKSDKNYALADATKKIHMDAGWTLVKTVSITGPARLGAKRIKDGKENKKSEEETFCFKKNVIVTAN